METPCDSERVGQTLTALPDSIPLVPKGARLSYRHYRYVMDGKKKKLIRYMRNDLHPTQVLPRGGKTECTIQIGDQFYRGEAVCGTSFPTRPGGHGLCGMRSELTTPPFQK
jgi:hypothetical protein